MNPTARTIKSANDLEVGHRRHNWVDAEGCLWSWDWEEGYWCWIAPFHGNRHPGFPTDFPWTEAPR